MCVCPCVYVSSCIAEKPKKSLYNTIKPNRDKNDKRKKSINNIGTNFENKILFHYNIDDNKIFSLKAHAPVFPG